MGRGGGPWLQYLVFLPRSALPSLDIMPMVLSCLDSIPGYLLRDNQAQIHLFSSVPFPTLNLKRVWKDLQLKKDPHNHLNIKPQRCRFGVK